jgi:hypothetical protein
MPHDSRRPARSAARRDEVDPEPQLAVEVPLPVIPPREAGLLGLEPAEGVDEAAALPHRGEARALRRHVRRADEGLRVVDVPVSGTDVHFAADRQRRAAQRRVARGRELDGGERVRLALGLLQADDVGRRVPRAARARAGGAP